MKRSPHCAVGGVLGFHTPDHITHRTNKPLKLEFVGRAVFSPLTIDPPIVTHTRKNFAVIIRSPASQITLLSLKDLLDCEMGCPVSDNHNDPNNTSNHQTMMRLSELYGPVTVGSTVSSSLSPPSSSFSRPLSSPADATESSEDSTLTA